MHDLSPRVFIGSYRKCYRTFMSNINRTGLRNVRIYSAEQGSHTLGAPHMCAKNVSGQRWLHLRTNYSRKYTQVSHIQTS